MKSSIIDTEDSLLMYSSDPETLPSYSPVPEVREYALRPRIVFNDSANETTDELTFQ